MALPCRPPDRAGDPVRVRIFENGSRNTLDKWGKNMYPKACKVIVDSDHQMQQATPEVVANAIRDVIGARDGQYQPALTCS